MPALSGKRIYYQLTDYGTGIMDVTIEGDVDIEDKPSTGNSEEQSRFPNLHYVYYAI